MHMAVVTRCCQAPALARRREDARTEHQVGCCPAAAVAVQFLDANLPPHRLRTCRDERWCPQTDTGRQGPGICSRNPAAGSNFHRCNRQGCKAGTRKNATECVSMNSRVQQIGCVGTTNHQQDGRIEESHGSRNVFQIAWGCRCCVTTAVCSCRRGIYSAAAANSWRVDRFAGHQPTRASTSPQLPPRPDLPIYLDAPNSAPGL
jgi:hypothetical protein